MNFQTLWLVLRNTILTSAITHLIILYTTALIQKDLSLANAFNILDFDLIWPQLSYGTTNFFLSYSFILSISIVWYLKLRKKS